MATRIIILVLLYASYRAFIALWRVKFHPLANFPGPRSAAISTRWQHAMLKRGRAEAELEKLHREYKTNVLRVGPNELHISDPSLYKVIYSQKSTYLKESPFYASFISTTVFSMVDPRQHKERRQLLNPFFSRAGIFKAESMIADKVGRLKNKLDVLCAPGSNHPINASNAFRCVTIDMITHYAFAESWGLVEKSDDDFFAPMLKAMDVASEGIWDMWHSPFLRELAAKTPTRVVHYFNKDVARFLDMKKLGHKSLETYRNAEKQDTQVVFDTLTASLTDEEDIVAEALGILVAGSDTTAFTLTVAVWHIAHNASLKQKLMKVLAEAFPAREAPMTLLKLEAIPYLSACVREALRMASTAPGKLPRVVPGGNADPLVVDGKVVPPGTIVGMSAYSMHTNEDTWGADAKEFNPDRWLGEGGKHLETYLVTFSKGLRSCIGQNLAFAEIYITLAMLFRNFDIAVDPVSEGFKGVGLDFFVPIVPDPGLILNMKKLES